jgi:hypothetical protein
MDRRLVAGTKSNGGMNKSEVLSALKQDGIYEKKEVAIDSFNIAGKSFSLKFLFKDSVLNGVNLTHRSAAHDFDYFAMKSALSKKCGKPVFEDERKGELTKESSWTQPETTVELHFFKTDEKEFPPMLYIAYRESKTD